MASTHAIRLLCSAKMVFAHAPGPSCHAKMAAPVKTPSTANATTAGASFCSKRRSAGFSIHWTGQIQDWPVGVFHRAPPNIDNQFGCQRAPGCLLEREVNGICGARPSGCKVDEFVRVPRGTCASEADCIPRGFGIAGGVRCENPGNSFVPIPLSCRLAHHQTTEGSWIVSASAVVGTRELGQGNSLARPFRPPFRPDACTEASCLG
jgi:hypothetical protein